MTSHRLEKDISNTDNWGKGHFPPRFMHNELLKSIWLQFKQRRKWQPTPVFLPEKSHGQRSLVGYRPWGCKELDMTEWLHFTHFKQRKKYKHVYKHEKMFSSTYDRNAIGKMRYITSWLAKRKFDNLWCWTEKAMAPHSSTLAWRIPGTVEPGGLPYMGSHRVGHDWSDLALWCWKGVEKQALTHVNWCHFFGSVTQNIWNLWPPDSVSRNLSNRIYKDKQR